MTCVVTDRPPEAPPADPPGLLERRLKSEAALLTLEREQGAALLDGKPFDVSAIAAVRAELEAIEQAERETIRRDGDATAERMAAARRQAAQDAQEALTAYAGAVTRCEASSKALAGELRAMEDAAATMRRCYLTMGRVLPTSLEAHTMRATMSRLVAGELAEIERPCGFGQLKWPSVPVGADWSEHVRKWIQPAVEAAIEKELAQ